MTAFPLHLRSSNNKNNNVLNQHTTTKETTAKPLYRRAKIWQIGLFSFNSNAVYLYTVLFYYIVYFASGVLGLGVAVVSMLLASMRLLDGIIDPFVGWLIDRTNGKFGKFRPFMIVGNILMACSLLLMYYSQYAGAAKFPLFVFAFVIHIFGHTCQYCITRAAQSALTNDPVQRPIFSMFDMITSILLYVGILMLVSNYLIVKHGDFTAELFRDFFVIIVLCSMVCTVLAIVGINKKDRTEHFDIIEKAPKIKLRDGWNMLRNNRTIQMLVISAATDKLFSNITLNAVVVVIIYGIICGDFALAGQVAIHIFPLSMVVSLLCIQFARKFGQKRAFLLATYGGMIFTMLLFLLFVFGDPTSLSFTEWGTFTVLYLFFLALRGGFISSNNSIITPMIADCADYEVMRSGKYLPGMVGALFTGVDQVFTSLNNVIIGVLVILAGYRASFPTVTTPYSTELFWVGMIAFCGLPMLGWVINIVCMRYYPLDREKMVEIQQKIQEIKSEAGKKER